MITAEMIREALFEQYGQKRSYLSNGFLVNYGKHGVTIYGQLDITDLAARLNIKAADQAAARAQ